jgi:hypothetical protein
LTRRQSELETCNWWKRRANVYQRAGTFNCTSRDDPTIMLAKATIGGLSSSFDSRSQTPATVTDSICEEASRACERKFGRGLRALILTGSFARGEGSFIRHNEIWQALSDAEFIAVLTDFARLPSAIEQREIQHKTCQALHACGVDCSLSFGFVHADFLRRLQPSIFAFELRACGRVLSGDTSVLSLAPQFRPSEIPLEDAWRLLCNRLVECLEVLACMGSQCEPVSPQASYRIVKLYLDMCTSLLVFCGAYEPRYAQRADALSKLAQSERADAPFSLSDFSKRVSAATDIKISRQSSESIGASSRKEMASVTAEAMAYARQLWRWELRKLTNGNDDMDDQQLLKRWMSQQGMSQRLHGWAYVCRKQGWHRSWREWGRWLRLLCQASPRYCVYAVASEMCFVLTSTLDAHLLTDSDCRRWRDLLPVRKETSGSERSPWSQLMAETIWNYQQFLVETRA